MNNITDKVEMISILKCLVIIPINIMNTVNLIKTIIKVWIYFEPLEISDINVNILDMRNKEKIKEFL